MQDIESVGGSIVTAGGTTTVTHPRKRCHRSTKQIFDISEPVFVKTFCSAIKDGTIHVNVNFC
jgi:hypothetical protein